MKKGKLTEHFAFLLSEEQLKQLREGAKRASLSAAEYVRQKLQRGSSVYVDEDEMQRCTDAVRSLGEKTSRVVIALNQDPHADPEQIMDLCEAYRAVVREINDFRLGKGVKTSGSA